MDPTYKGSTSALDRCYCCSMLWRSNTPRQPLGEDWKSRLQWLQGYPRDQEPPVSGAYVVPIFIVDTRIISMLKIPTSHLETEVRTHCRWWNMMNRSVAVATSIYFRYSWARTQTQKADAPFSGIWFRLFPENWPWRLPSPQKRTCSRRPFWSNLIHFTGDVDLRCFWIVAIMKTSRKTSCPLALSRCGHRPGLSPVSPILRALKNAGEVTIWITTILMSTRFAVSISVCINFTSCPCFCFPSFSCV